jgi:hypothetical protein
VKLNIRCALDLELLLPAFRRPIASRIEEPIEHGEKYRPLQGEAAVALGELMLDGLIDTQLAPQPIEDQSRTD